MQLIVAVSGACCTSGYNEQLLANSCPDTALGPLICSTHCTYAAHLCNTQRTMQLELCVCNTLQQCLFCDAPVALSALRCHVAGALALLSTACR